MLAGDGIPVEGTHGLRGKKRPAREVQVSWGVLVGSMQVSPESRMERGKNAPTTLLPRSFFSFSSDPVLAVPRLHVAFRANCTGPCPDLGIRYPYNYLFLKAGTSTCRYTPPPNFHFWLCSSLPVFRCKDTPKYEADANLLMGNYPHAAAYCRILHFLHSGNFPIPPCPPSAPPSHPSIHPALTTALIFLPRRYDDRNKTGFFFFFSPWEMTIPSTTSARPAMHSSH
ncbi:uncharacterized protein LY79DRAFT_50412 [Colletotrichum navitas]|uniref:Uncharacterized protein n=1 Tax=Colletotrichum navitas TaxID=681940 RepID=A0AAD8Q6Q4_9PEZI|nr:uncharacterized protein LY79DRAFT_50412 [Colletotrichum navitas]KAK1596649.1 hypothetical protein LY79DRAFT_50412 [Colletotrichum navitas]